MALLEMEAEVMTPPEVHRAAAEAEKAAAEAEARRQVQYVETRKHRLRGLFEIFDFDRSGAIDTSELLLVGQAMCRDQNVMWSGEQNEALMERMDANRDGVVQQVEFVEYCEKLLPRDQATFEAFMQSYESEAGVVRHAKDALTLTLALARTLT